MVRLVKYKEKQKKKPGRPTNLIVEDQILLDFGQNQKMLAECIR